jgi:superfamily I DNA/RNA helicase
VQEAYSHADLVQKLEKNYRSTPQILAVGKALLVGSGATDKQLIPTVSGKDKPPVRLLVVDTEDDEAAMIAKVGDRGMVCPRGGGVFCSACTSLC